jgi:hypothetical protein
MNHTVSRAAPGADARTPARLAGWLAGWLAGGTPMAWLRADPPLPYTAGLPVSGSGKLMRRLLQQAELANPPAA